MILAPDERSPAPARSLTSPVSLKVLVDRSGDRSSLPSSPDSVRSGHRLIDSHGRTIRDLRISLTDRCNFRCVYCMDPGVRFRPEDDLLTGEEVIRLSRIACSLGITKLRLTGGEPSLREDLEAIIAGIRSASAMEMAVTTNGSLLDRPRAEAWKRAGLSRVTLSLDSLDPVRFARITRSACTPDVVLRAARACIDEGLTPLKINAVLVRGFNDDEAPALAGLARRLGVEVRFIEFMPLDSGRRWDPSLVVPAEETLGRIAERFPLVPTEADEPSSTASTFRFADGSPGLIGVIAPVSRPFCGACSRLRITADGNIRPCLFSHDEWNLMPLLRGGASDEAIENFLKDATWTKQRGHGITMPGFASPRRPMSAIGG